MKTFEELYGFKACYECVESDIKRGEDPIRLLGEFVLRDKQDKFFNSTMIDAMLKYIEDNNIKWNDK